MDLINPTQIIILILFIGTLLAALVFVRRFQPQLRKTLNTTRDITIRDRMALGAANTLFVVRIDDQEFMVVTSRRAGAVITPITATSTQETE